MGWYFMRLKKLTDMNSRPTTGCYISCLSAVATRTTLSAFFQSDLGSAVILDRVVAAAVQRHEIAAGIAALQRMHRHTDLVTRLQCSRIPAQFRQDRHRTEFNRKIDLLAIPEHDQVDPCMRVGPLEFFNRSLDLHALIDI